MIERKERERKKVKNLMVPTSEIRIRSPSFYNNLGVLNAGWLPILFANIEEERKSRQKEKKREGPQKKEIKGLHS